MSVFLDDLAMAVHFWMTPQPTGSYEAVAAYVDIGWVAYIRATQALIESHARLIFWVGYTWVGRAIGGVGRNPRRGSRGRAGADGGRAGLSAGG